MVYWFLNLENFRGKKESIHTILLHELCPVTHKLCSWLSFCHQLKRNNNTNEKEFIQVLDVSEKILLFPW